MLNDAVDNQIVVAERPKDPPPGTRLPPGMGPLNPRARTTILTGRIKHDCSLRPVFSDTYRRQMRERNKKYNTPQRQIRMIEEAGVPGGRGGVNRLSSGVGVGVGNAFGNLIVSGRVSRYALHGVDDVNSNRSRSLQRARSSVWRGCRGTSCWI
jgi:transcription initiation factor TFIIF subunit beta